MEPPGIFCSHKGETEPQEERSSPKSNYLFLELTLTPTPTLAFPEDQAVAKLGNTFPHSSLSDTERTGPPGPSSI